MVGGPRERDRDGDVTNEEETESSGRFDARRRRRRGQNKKARSPPLDDGLRSASLNSVRRGARYRPDCRHDERKRKGARFDDLFFSKTRKITSTFPGCGKQLQGTELLLMYFPPRLLMEGNKNKREDFAYKRPW